MQRMWVSLRENINCRNKLSDVMCHPTKQRSQGLEDEGESKIKDDHTTNTFVVNMANFKQCALPRSFEELDVEDPSRKVIEKILAAYLTNPTKKLPKIRRVFKVKNSHKVVEKFEKYRDMVKQKTKERDQKHLRSLVDGNELLCFYVTCMTCDSRNSKWVSGPCHKSDCSLCRIIGLSFDIENTKKFRIELCMSSEALSESVDAVSKGKNMKRAVIICRIIAGRTRSIEDKTSEDEYDSIRNRGFHRNSEYLTLNNSNAVLPCFIIVLN